jgi:uncharacterized protein (TIGR03437 family)
MRVVRSIPGFLLLALPLFPATFGTVVAPPGGASYSDIVLDESRTQLYLVNSNINRVDVYNYRTRAFVTGITTDALPVSAALSRDRQSLYVTAYGGATLDIIDLNVGIVRSRVPLPTNPEGVAVGADGRVLVTAVGVGTATANTLLIVDPAAGSWANVPVVPPASTPPVLPAPNGRTFLSYRSRLLATPDGKWIVGANGTSATGKVVFLYESASGTVLRSRQVTNLSTTLAVAADGSKFMAGATLFDAQTLQVMAQETTANAPFTFVGATGSTQFNLQANQGGSVFAPDGSALYAAFNIAPVGSTRPNVTQLMINDPDNLLINMGLEMPENLAGKMVIDAAGASIYAISDSGFTILPVGTISQSPLAAPQTRSVVLINDVCGVFKGTTGTVGFDNAGRGRFTVALTAQSPTTIVFPVPGQPPGPPQVITLPAPTSAVNNTGATPVLTFRYNPANANNPGTVGPVDYVISSPEAINNPGTIHVYQNNRDSVSTGNVVPVQINTVTSEGLTDILLDNARRRLYIANSGMNRIEVFDIAQQKFISTIKVGQLPHAMAFGTDGNTLYVANTGGESISIVDLNRGVQTGRVAFPAFPMNAAVTITNPTTLAVSIRGPQFVMSDGSWWKVTQGLAVPRGLNAAIFGTARTLPGGNPALWSMTATPGGEYVMVLNGAGTAYLYDSGVDDFTVTRQVLTTINGYIGPVTAGPQGRYFAVGGTFLNSSLTPVAGGTTGLSAGNRLVPAVTAVSANQVALFTMPVRANINAAVTDAGLVELYDPASGLSQGSLPMVEGPAITVNGAARTSIFSRLMAVDAASASAYVLTASGLSIVKLSASATNPALRPTVNPGGIVSLADYTPPLAAGGLITIFGKNLAADGTANPPLPTSLGGTCVTLNNNPIPLSLTSAGQINGQVPVGLAAGRYPLIIRSLSNSVASTTTTITISSYAPAVMIGQDGQPAITHADGRFVDQQNPAKRDETLTIYATGMGATKGGAITTGNPAPVDPPAVTNAVSVYFGNPLYKQSAMIVRSSEMAPGMVGVTQIQVTVPGFHTKGSAVPVTIKVGGVSSSTTGPAAPYIPVN